MIPAPSFEWGHQQEARAGCTRQHLSLSPGSLPVSASRSEATGGPSQASSDLARSFIPSYSHLSSVINHYKNNWLEEISLNLWSFKQNLTIGPNVTLRQGSDDIRQSELEPESEPESEPWLWRATGRQHCTAHTVKKIESFLICDCCLGRNKHKQFLFKILIVCFLTAKVAVQQGLMKCVCVSVPLLKFICLKFTKPIRAQFETKWPIRGQY